LRVEQLYPFPEKGLLKELNRHKNIKEIIWCQEEPKNMGGWAYMKENIDDLFSKRDVKPKTIKYVGRAASASTATGLMANHKAQLENIFKRVFVANIKKEIK
jgi:2-oxoglutarate dehydrogenase E1 component